MVEDNQDIGTFTRPMLEQLGFQVLWVKSAAEALHELSGNPENFHVVFSDIAMPGMSGLELSAEIEARYPWMPVVLTTGYSTEFATIARTRHTASTCCKSPIPEKIWRRSCTGR